MFYRFSMFYSAHNFALYQPTFTGYSPHLDPAEVSGIRTTLDYQSKMLRNFQDQLEKAHVANNNLTSYVHSLPQTKSVTLPDKF